MRKFVLILLSLACLAPALAKAAPAGTLSAYEPATDAPDGMQAWRVRYWTTSDRDELIEVTGMVIAPNGPPPVRPRPVLAWAHGTWGVVEDCAPSLGTNFYTATPGLTEAIQRGYTVVAPDYPGLGTTMPHPFLVGTSTGNSVLDAVRAARGIPRAAAGSTFAVWGESQGGHAALWTGQLARSYAPDLKLVGVAAAAPTTDLTANLNAGSDPSVRAFMIAFAAYSWSQHFGAPLATLGKKSTGDVITRLARNNCLVLDQKPKLGMVLGVLVLRRDLKKVDLGRIEPWATLARANSPAARPYGVPFWIAQNPKDVVVGAAVTQKFARELCRAGAAVQYITISGKGHETSARDTAGPTLDWIDARFAGLPAPSDCKTL